MNKKLEVGEKYLSIKLAGHDFVKAFRHEKQSSKEPDFKGDGVAVWVLAKKAEPAAVKVDEQDIL